jgi:wyosine [tRNA(Phe)-imidazoG37] synthetase (radical SAM superfamily)
VKRVEHIFGPVRSRRLGLSLGVDLVPYKTCPFDCIYCQLGRTTHWTGERAEYVSASEVLEDLKRSLSQVPRPDFITLSGSGEPTLHSGIGEIIAGIRTITPIPIAVLTNGALFDNQDVRSGCGLADVVLPSLDAGDESTYAKVNRPLAGLTLRSLVDGLAVFREEFHGDIWLEVLLIRGITDGDEAVRKIARHAGNIRPDRIHLNTAVRPTADDSVWPVSLPELRRFARFFSPEAQIAFSLPPGSEKLSIPEEKLVEILRRRPCTIEEIGEILQFSPVHATKTVDLMVRDGQLKVIRQAGCIHYTAALEKKKKNERRNI